MLKEGTKISVVVPVYNASRVLIELKKQLDEVFAKMKIPYQLVLVDDFSRDDSWQVIREIKEKDAGIVAVRLGKNFGQHNALVCGMHYCTGDYVVTIDDDLQYRPADIELLVAEAEKTNADVIYGIPTHYKKAWYRKAGSGWLKVATKISSPSIGEGSAFRLLKRDIVKKLVNHKQYFVYIDELLAWYTMNVAFTTVKHEQSRVKESRYSSITLFRLYYELLMGYNATPLKMIAFMGFFASVISFLVGAYFIFKKIFFHVRIGYTGVMVSITFTAGLLLLSIGIIGEHLRRMYNILNSQPQYSVAEVLE